MTITTTNANIMNTTVTGTMMATIGTEFGLGVFSGGFGSLFSTTTLNVIELLLNVGDEKSRA